MIIVGLTGSIGMGKSFVAQQFHESGALLFDADRTVHCLLEKGGDAYEPVKKLFPQALHKGEINRKKLGDIVFADIAKLRSLEQILHPLVRAHMHAFLKQARRQRAWLAILDIPLLFENGIEEYCDYVIVVTAPQTTQMERVLDRKGMNKSKFNQINQQQLATSEKRKRADKIIHTGLDKRFVLRQVKAIVSQLRKGKVHA